VGCKFNLQIRLLFQIIKILMFNVINKLFNWLLICRYFVWRFTFRVAARYKYLDVLYCYDLDLSVLQEFGNVGSKFMAPRFNRMAADPDRSDAAGCQVHAIYYESFAGRREGSVD
jgi:hypothetical protein